MLAPAGLPPEIAPRLTGDLKAILDSHEFATRLEPLGVTAFRFCTRSGLRKRGLGTDRAMEAWYHLSVA